MSPDRRGGWIRWGTAARLATFLTVILALVLGLSLWALLRAFSAQSEASATRSLVTEMRSFSTEAGHRPPSQDVPTFAEAYLRTRALPDGEFLIAVLPRGVVLGSARSEALLNSQLVVHWRNRPPTTGLRERLHLADRSYLVAASPLVLSGTRTGLLIAAVDLGQVSSDVARVRSLALGEGLVALATAVAGGYLLLRRLLRRVGRITATAAAIGAGRLDQRLGDQGTDDEVGQLAATFDDMADRLDAAMTSQRRLLSDVSHQLRTPLTVARGHLEVLQRGGLTDKREVRQTISLVVGELDDMRALVERLLLLGRAFEPDFLEREPTDLRSFCADLMDSARVLARRRWQLAPVPDLVLLVDTGKLRGALLNLIDNAVRATSRTTDVIAVAAAVAEDGAVVLTVDDTGPGIPPERREKVLERFARPGAADAEGSGLGLAIASAVAAAHDGHLSIHDSPLGGCQVRITLPADVTVSVVPDDEPKGTVCAS